MKTHPFRILTVTVKAPFAAAYEFAAQPENFPKWAPRLRASMRHTEDGWVADTPDGEAIVRFSPANEFGVIDHSIKLPGKPEVYIPMRMLPNGGGTQIELLLFRASEMSDDEYEQQTAIFKEDLHSLKTILEVTARPPPEVPGWSFQQGI